MEKRHILIILDGYGIAEDPAVSAIDAAKKPFLDSLFASCPHGTLQASGLAVGLPEGQMGNSEVGHMNLGAGRVVYQDITRIDLEIQNGGFYTNEALIEAFQIAEENDSTVHLLGLLSDGGVHSSIEHVYAILQMAAQKGLTGRQVAVHVLTDGRDTDPEGGVLYVKALESKMRDLGVGFIASVIGRYYAMDRDNRWERVKMAYDLLTAGVGAPAESAIEALKTSYLEGITDEFVRPVHTGLGSGLIKSNDVVVCFNFRADRMRQICRALSDPTFDGFDRQLIKNLHVVTFSRYHATFPYPVAFPKVNLNRTLGEVVSDAGLIQLRAAETEKYPHVTYFFSGGREKPYPGEERILAPSPKVATYDLQPEMSARELAAKVAEAITTEKYNLVILNFANPDMVGHTGVFDAAVAAVETVDECTSVVVQAARKHGYSVEIIADHGNADKMRNPDGSPNTAHTTALVPHLIMAEGFNGPVRPGKLGDVAPTILALLGIDRPIEMTGKVLI